MSSGAAQGDRQWEVHERVAPDTSNPSAGGEPLQVTAGAGRVAPGSQPPPPSLLDAVLSSTRPAAGMPDPQVAQFFAESDLASALRIYVKNFVPVGELRSRQALQSHLARELARLDRILARQVNSILHHPQLQQLEASWRGIWMLTGQVQEAQDAAELEDDPPEFQVRLLNVSKTLLRKDLVNAREFDQSEIFKKVYEDGFGMSGSYPFGALIGDYQFTKHQDDLYMLEGMAGVAAAAFAPFIAAASPELLGLEDFGTLEQPIRLTDNLNQVEDIKWNAFRNSEDSRFVGLVLPRVLMRVPYDDDGSRSDGFRFREEVEGPDRSRYLWGNAAYAFGSVLIRSYGACRWYADIRGVERGMIGGGLVTELPVHSFGTDRSGVALKSSLEVSINDFQEKELSTLGFIPISACQDTGYSVFYTNASTQKPKTHADVGTTTNAKMSAMLQYTLCASRFAHYLKTLGRNKIGTQQGASELERELQDWIAKYVAAGSQASASTKAKFPLRDAKIEVTEIPSKPGSYRLVIQLLPHFQLDGLSSMLRFSMERI